MAQEARGHEAPEYPVPFRPYASAVSSTHGSAQAAGQQTQGAAPSQSTEPAPAPHPHTQPAAATPASAQPAKPTPVGRLGTTCRAVYCQGEDARITKDNPGCDVPKKDIARRGAFLMRIWQSCVGDNSPQLHERVQRELANAARRLEIIAHKKANGEKVNATDYPSRIRIHRSHFPPGSFEKSNDRRTTEADRMKADALPFNYLEYRTWKAAQMPEQPDPDTQGQTQPQPPGAGPVVPLDGNRLGTSGALAPAGPTKRPRITKRTDPQLLLEDLQQAEREMKKLKKEIERMEQERVTAQERLDNIKTLIKGYEKRNAVVQKRDTPKKAAGGNTGAKRYKQSST